MEILLNSRKYDFLEIGSSLESVNVRFFESFVRDSFLWHQWLAPSEFYMYQCSYNKLLSAFSRSLSLSILFTFVLTEAVVQRCSVKKVFLEILLFRLRPATLLKKRLWHRCLPVNFTKFLWTPFFYKTPPVAASTFIKNNPNHMVQDMQFYLCVCYHCFILF